jgi:hypothetical protein
VVLLGSGARPVRGADNLVAFIVPIAYAILNISHPVTGVYPYTLKHSGNKSKIIEIPFSDSSFFIGLIAVPVSGYYTVFFF